MTGEARMLAEMADDVAQARVAPEAERIDREGSVPPSLVEALAEQGLLDAGVPERSGDGVDHTFGLIVVSSLARVSASVGALVAAVHEAAAAYGDRGRLGAGGASWLPGVVSTGVEARAVEPGLALTGSAVRVEHAPAASQLLVVARRDDGEECVVEVGMDDPAVRVGDRERTTGLRGVPIAAVELEDVVVGEGAVVGGPADVRRAWTTRALMQAALGLGIAAGAWEAAARYAGERRQFGATIDTFPEIRGHLLTMEQHVETVGALLWSAATHDPEDSRAMRHAAHAARAALQGCQVVPRLAVQVLGGYGYIEEYPVEMRMRDGVSLAARAGGSEALLEALSSLEVVA
jgi:alkylation response protein AidB-like acyl-CoA dehydrogenase